MKLKEALEWYVQNYPAFRSKPIGTSDSLACIKQDEHIAAEDCIKRMLQYLEMPGSGYAG